jgi:hypothetical protein
MNSTDKLQLHFGVVDVSYSDDNGGTTTGDVAGYLEDRYHIMRTFLELKEDEIQAILLEQYAGAIESIAQGKRMSKLDLEPAMGKVEAMFRDFLDSGEMNRLVGSYAVSDATLKTSARRKSGKLPEGQQRQAFIDSGLFQASFRAWIAP